MSEADVRAALAGTGLGELLEVIVTSHDVGAAKPDPRGVQAALHALGAAPSEALFVGDADVDEAAAAAAGVAFARVTKPHDDAPTSTVDSPLQLAVRAALTERSGPLHAALAPVGDRNTLVEGKRG